MKKCQVFSSGTAFSMLHLHTSFPLINKEYMYYILFEKISFTCVVYFIYLQSVFLTETQPGLHSVSQYDRWLAHLINNGFGLQKFTAFNLLKS